MKPGRSLSLLLVILAIAVFTSLALYHAVTFGEWNRDVRTANAAARR